jgi:argininosuccinate lyase
VFADMLPKIEVKSQNMYQAAFTGFSTATDLADYLVRKGLPFRDAHEIVGQAVRHGIEHEKDLSQFSLDEFKSFSDVIDQDVFEVLTLEGSVAARDHIGGTAPSQVKQAIARARKRLK